MRGQPFAKPTTRDHIFTIISILVSPAMTKTYIVHIVATSNMDISYTTSLFTWHSDASFTL